MSQIPLDWPTQAWLQLPLIPFACNHSFPQLQLNQHLPKIWWPTWWPNCKLICSKWFKHSLSQLVPKVKKLHLPLCNNALIYTHHYNHLYHQRLNQIPNLNQCLLLNPNHLPLNQLSERPLTNQLQPRNQRGSGKGTRRLSNHLQMLDSLHVPMIVCTFWFLTTCQLYALIYTLIMSCNSYILFVYIIYLGDLF